MFNNLRLRCPVSSLWRGRAFSSPSIHPSSGWRAGAGQMGHYVRRVGCSQLAGAAPATLLPCRAAAVTTWTVTVRISAHTRQSWWAETWQQERFILYYTAAPHWHCTAPVHVPLCYVVAKNQMKDGRLNKRISWISSVEWASLKNFNLYFETLKLQIYNRLE